MHKNCQRCERGECSVEQNQEVDVVQDPSSSCTCHAVQVSLLAAAWRYTDAHRRQGLHATTTPSPASVTAPLLADHSAACQDSPRHDVRRRQWTDGLAGQRRGGRQRWWPAVSALYVYVEACPDPGRPCSSCRCRASKSDRYSDVLFHVQAVVHIDGCRRRASVTAAAIVRVRLRNPVRPATARRHGRRHRLLPAVSRPARQIGRSITLPQHASAGINRLNCFLTWFASTRRFIITWTVVNEFLARDNV